MPPLVHVKKDSAEAERFKEHLFLPLPPYSPELNPIERLWDIANDKICNRVFETLDAIEETLTEALCPYWEKPVSARNLGGYTLKQTLGARTLY